MAGPDGTLQKILRSALEEFRSNQAAIMQQFVVRGDAAPGIIPIIDKPAEPLLTGLFEIGRAIVSYVSDNHGSIPAASLGLLGLLFVLHTKPDGYSLEAVSLIPERVLQGEQYHRLLSSCTTHLDGAHLACSAAVLLPHMMSAESNYGRLAAATDVAALAGISGALQVAACWLGKELLHAPGPYCQLNSIGLMPTALGLRMVHAFETRTLDALLGVLPCPSKLSPWATLLVVHACVPGQSFLANMCGLAAGMVYATAVTPALHRLGFRRHRRRLIKGRLADIPASWVPSTRRKPWANLGFQLGLSLAALAVRALVGRAGRSRRQRG